jgi:hypothetical protein
MVCDNTVGKCYVFDGKRSYTRIWMFGKVYSGLSVSAKRGVSASFCTFPATLPVLLLAYLFASLLYVQSISMQNDMFVCFISRSPCLSRML